MTVSSGLLASSRGGPMQVYSLSHLYLLEVSLSPDGDGETGIDPFPSLTSGTLVNDVYSDTSSIGEAMLWLCPICKTPQGDMDMIRCDLCAEWFHFGCVGMDWPLPKRRKWYFPDSARQKKKKSMWYGQFASSKKMAVLDRT